MPTQLFMLLTAVVIVGLLVFLYLAYLNICDLHLYDIRLYPHERLIDWFFTKVLRLGTNPNQDED